MGCARKLSLYQVTDSYNVNYVVMPFCLRFVTLDLFLATKESGILFIHNAICKDNISLQNDV